MVKLNLISIPLFMLLTGCISLAPKNSLNTSTVPPYLNQSEDHTSSDLSDIGWHRYFKDEQLIILIKMALTNNTDIRLATLKALESYKQYGIEQSSRYPQVTGQTSIEYAGKNRDETSRNYNIGASFSFEIDLFGRLKNLSQSQLEAYLATEEAKRNVYLLLVSQVAQAYFNEQIIVQKIATADKQMENYQQALALIESRLVSGDSTYLDYEQARGMLESIKVSRVDLLQEQQLAHHTLQNLVNRYDLMVKPVTDLNLINVAIPSNLPSTALLKQSGYSAG